ncbi:MAG: AAA family ATPase [Pseudomonadota bacterium]
MSTENTLFDEDFDLDFEGEEFAADSALDEDLSEEFASKPEIEPVEDEPVDVYAPDEPIPYGAAPITEGGARPVPAISAIFFFETTHTAQTFRTVGQDRRMSRVAMEVHSGGLAAAIAYMSENATPNLLVIESGEASRQMLAMVDELASHCEPGIEVLIIGSQNDIGLYRQLMSRGISEYLVPPIEPIGLINTISDLFADPEAPFLGKSIAVVGAKGGAGSSTIAHNLAWSIAENVGMNTTLVDLDLSFGTTSLDFNQENPQTVLDALLAPERADAAVIDRLLTVATDRLSLFTAPSTIQSVVDIPNEAYDYVIDVVRQVVPMVILDLPHVWSKWTEQTLIGADEILLVCKPDLATLRNAKNLADHLTAARPNDSAPRLAINMAGMPSEIPVKEFSAALELEPEIIVPFDPKLFGQAANNGQMLSELQADAKPSVLIDQLASTLTGRTAAKPEKSFLQKIMGK